MRYGSLRFLDDGPEKPVRIWTRIGRRPVARGRQFERRRAHAAVRGGDPDGLSLLIHHDDDRAAATSPYDKGAEQALDGRGRRVDRVSVRRLVAGVPRPVD